jgi:nucleolar protein 4
MTSVPANRQKKSTLYTVFCRFTPPLDSLRRHDLETALSNVGPIKKASLILQDSKAFGFVKFTCQQDAEAAAKQCNGINVTLSDGQTTVLHVGLASESPNTSGGGTKAAPSAGTTKSAESADTTNLTGTEQDELATKKKNCRLILRNLPFTANEKDIRKVLKQYGELLEVHLPTVKGMHRGFGFVTYQTAAQAKAACVEGQVEIKGRTVQVGHALNKTVHQQQKQKEEKTSLREKKQQAKATKPAVGDDVVDESNVNHDDDDDFNDKNDDDDNADDHSQATDSTDDTSGSQHDNDAVSEKRELFLRNLPFDATRQDVFELMRQFGHIRAIYICRDKVTGIPKGTAFCIYEKQASAQRAIDGAEGLVCKDRSVQIDFAVDKDTATTLTTTEKDNRLGKDRRNMYLKEEGRVHDESWDHLPDGDKEKRQRAWSEKTTKLRSPLFFINPTRLSIRNLNKTITEAQLKQLCVQATTRGLERKLVTSEDEIKQWKAKGELTTREILARIQELEQDKNTVVPEFDDKNVRRYIPSVFIDRDFNGGSKNKQDAPSRGFGFVQFEHHAHALACLRELNNSVEYASEFVIGGKHAMDVKKRAQKRKKMDQADSELVGEDGRVKIPRLIVEFTVENKVKAKQQAENRSKQESNMIKQKGEQTAPVTKKEKNKSRGKKQREKKRKQLESGEPEQSIDTKNKTKEVVAGLEIPVESEKPKMKAIKPQKKQKIDKDEAKFTELVESYKRSFAATSEETATVEVSKEKANSQEKRWFE